MKTSSFRAKSHLVFHWCLYNKYSWLNNITVEKQTIESTPAIENYYAWPEWNVTGYVEWPVWEVHVTGVGKFQSQNAEHTCKHIEGVVQL